MVVRRVARPMLASLFVAAGSEALKALPPKPAGKTLTQDPMFQFKANAAAMVGGGSLLAIGRLPRIAALTCAASLVPTTYVAHPFWKMKDPAAKRDARVHFLKNLSILGGLLVTAVDKQGKESVSRKVRRNAKQSGRAAAAVGAGTTLTVARAGRKTRKKPRLLTSAS